MASQSDGRRCSTKFNVDQRAPILVIAVCGVSPAVKNP